MSEQKEQAAARATEQDMLRFEAFQFAKLSEYFTGKAKTEPETAPDSLWVSSLFSSASRLDESVLTKEGYVSPAQVNTILTAQIVRDDLRATAEGPKMDEYVFSRINEFDPARLARIEQADPAVAVKARRFKMAG